MNSSPVRESGYMAENKKQVLFLETDQNNPTRLIVQMIVNPLF